MVTTRPTAPSYIIKRPRLTKLLDESEARIILLCAPAGYGKTTLAREWVSGDALWYAVRPTDCDVAAFAAGLAELFADATAATDLDPVERVRSLAVRGLPAKSLARPIADAAAAIGTKATLVVDDYHHAAESAEADSLFHELTLRSDFRIVLTSRVRPPWVTARSMVYGDVLLIGTEQLAFTEEETKSALAPATGSMDSELFRVVGGWPAVIGLAAVQGSTSDLSRTLAPRALYDFFAEELFGSAEPLVQQSMLQLAAAGDSSLEVARDLIGGSFDDVLQSATNRGFLSHELDHQRLVMHPLLREFFLTRIAELDQSQIASVVRPVVQRLNEGHHWDDCLTLLKRLPDADLIPTTMSAAMDHLLASGRIATIQQWVELARGEQIEHPVVLLAEAEVALCGGRNDHAQALALRAAVSLPSDDLAAQAYLTAARAAHLGDDLVAAARHAEHAGALGAGARVHREALWLAFVSAHESGSIEATRFLHALSALGGSDPGLALRVACARALQTHVSGRTGEAVAICEQAEALLLHLRDPLQLTGFLNVFAHVCYTAARYEQSLSLVKRLVDEADASGLDFPLSYGLLTRAYALVSTRRLLRARRLLGDLAKQPAVSAHISGNATMCMAKLHVAAGDLDRAAALLDIEPPAGANYPLVGELSALRGLIEASRGSVNRAEVALAHAEDLSHYVDTTTAAALGRAVIALRGDLHNSRAIAVAAVDAVMEIGNREVLVTGLRAFPPLISACVDRPVARKLIPLLVASHDVRLGRRFGLEMPREAVRGGKLSNRELEVYELVAQGRSNKQIAGTLFISESTTKVHVRHIFEKLGVHSRVELAALRTDEDSSEH